MHSMPFTDRFQAGKLLAEKLLKYKNKPDVIILAIPRGALQIGYEVAKALNCPLDIVLTKKIPFPDQPEYAIGAVGYGGEVILNRQVILQNQIPDKYIKEQTEKIKNALQSKYKKYRGTKPQLNLKNKTVIIVDDGIATGHTMVAAIQTLRKQNPKKIIAAFPVGPHEGVINIEREADECVCLKTPDMFFAIGQFYDEFTQVEDKEAIELLKKANEKIKEKK